MKKITSISTLCLVLMVGIISYVFWNSRDARVTTKDTENRSQLTETVSKGDPHHAVTTLEHESNPLFKTELSGNNTSTIFNVDEEYKHVKIFIENSGKKTIKAVMVHDRSSNEYFVEKVAPGETIEWTSFTKFPQGVEEGKYYITYRADGDNFSGQAWGISSEIASDM